MPGFWAKLPFGVEGGMQVKIVEVVLVDVEVVVVLVVVEVLVVVRVVVMVVAHDSIFGSLV